MEEQVKLIGQATDEQIAEWKKKYALGIFSVVSEAGHVGYFKNPGRNEVNCALSSNRQPLDPLDELATLTFIGGSDQMLKNDTISLGVLNSLKGKLDGQRAVLVNL